MEETNYQAIPVTDSAKLFWNLPEVLRAAAESQGPWPSIQSEHILEWRLEGTSSEMEWVHVELIGVLNRMRHPRPPYALSTLKSPNKVSVRLSLSKKHLEEFVDSFMEAAEKSATVR